MSLHLVPHSWKHKIRNIPYFLYSVHCVSVGQPFRELVTPIKLERENKKQISNFFCFLVFEEKSKNNVEPKEKDALTGSRTRNCCLEGNNANRYTINASHSKLLQFDVLLYFINSSQFPR